MYHQEGGHNHDAIESVIDDHGLIRPILARYEDGELAVLNDWERVEKASQADEDVPVWLPNEGDWTDGKALIAQLVTGTSLYQNEMDWLQRAWLIEDLWDELGDTLNPSPSGLSEMLDISPSRAKTWIEPIRNAWSETVLDQDMYENREIRHIDGNDNINNNRIEGDDIIENVKPGRLRDIRNITKTRSKRIELLHGLISGDLDYEDLKRTKQRVKNSDADPLDALDEVQTTEPSEFDITFTEETAASLADLASEKGLDETKVIKEQVTELLQDEGFETRPEDGVDHEYLGQQQYLNEHVDTAPPEPTLLMESNALMSEQEDESVHLTVTSPPYDVGWDYGPEYDDSMDYSTEYLPMILDTFEEVYRLTVAGGHLCLVVPHTIDVANDDIEIPEGTLMASDIAELLTTKGEWQMQDFVIWKKPYNKAGLRDQSRWPYPPRNSLNNFIEAVVVLKKPGMRNPTEKQRKQSRIIRKGNSKDKDLRDNVWHISTENWEPQYTDSGNTAQFPEKLAKRCILHWSFVGDTVLDPFCGRGTTLKMAKRLHRESIGYEIQEELERDIREYVGIE